MLDGVYAYFYDNLTTGTRQEKYEHVAVEFDGTSSSRLPCTFPGDFGPSVVGNDGTIYGVPVLYFGSQPTYDPYELMPNAMRQVHTKFTYIRQVIAESGLQMTIKAAQAGGLEVQTRSSPKKDWKPANTPLPGNPVNTVQLRLSGNHLLMLNGTEVYISGN